LGDSLTAGLGVDPSESYPAKLQQKLDAAGYHYRVVNAGVSGDTSAQGLNRVDAVRALHPAIAIVALGANDGLRGIPVEQTRRNLDAIITVLRKDGAKVVLAGMQLPPNLGPVYTNQFRDMFRDLAKARNTPLVPFLLEGVGGRRDLNQEDGVHPTAAGYDIVAENVWRTLKPQLDSLQ
jgi:acyl-CoA thioesterase-1